MEHNQYEKIIDEAYRDYSNNFLGYEDVPSKFWFTENAQNNPLFMDRWGIKIRAQRINLSERIRITSKNHILKALDFGIGDESHDFAHSVCDEYNTPREKLIVNYKGKIGEKYG